MKHLLILLSCVVFSIPISVSAESLLGGLKLHQKAIHLLDRLAYGPRPGELEKIEKAGEKGILRWIDSQLNPENIGDESLDIKLSKFKSLQMPLSQLISTYIPPNEVAEKMGIKKEDFQSNEDLKKEIRKKIGEDLLPEKIEQDMRSQRIIRAVESRRQLQEILVDFWLNHFNIDMSKGQDRWLFPDFEKNVIRKYLLGRFGDFLNATAHHPAMLFYLDNHLSQSPLDYSAQRQAKLGGNLQGSLKKRATGLNENYAREILELHTMGVDGGYTQSDVTELARILTGWSIDEIKKNPAFIFRDRVHDKGNKVFLRQTFAEGRGIDEGERALEMIASHPSTAHFISFKLARYFVSDEPPKKLVNHLAQTFLRSHGNLKEVYRELFRSPEFWSKAAYRAKVKKPFHFVISSIRALGGEVDLKNDLYKTLNMMGEEIYHCVPPTGYKDIASVWVNPGAMVSRLNFALKLASNRVDGVYTQLPKMDPTPNNSQQLVRAIEKELLHDRMGKIPESVVLKEIDGESRTMADGEVRPLSLAKAAGLILGSPDFQRR